MSRTHEETTFSRDCPAIVIPDGFDVVIPVGTHGIIIQVLGGNYTVQTALGYLVRVSGEEADAIGKEAVARHTTDEDAPAAVLDDAAVWAELRTCYDPEIPVNIVDLGLIYGFRVDPGESGKAVIEVQMTLTAPGCGMGQVLTDDVEYKLTRLAGVEAARVELIFDPPWTPERMSEEARLELGF
mgnify:CR=1 FL=1